MKSARFEQAAIGVPAERDCLVRVVEQIDIAGYPRAGDQFIARGPARHVALCRGDPIVRYEATESAVELCESHWRRAATRTWASRSP